MNEWPRESPRRGGVTTSSQTPPLVEEGATLINTYMSRREQKNLVMIPMGFETKTYCAGEGQQHFDRPTICAVELKIFFHNYKLQKRTILLQYKLVRNILV
jgi:hypothetical protein